MADKPSRALVLFGEGLASLLGSDGAGRCNLGSFASLAACGFLALRDASPPSPPAEDIEDQIANGDLAQLLDVYDLCSAGDDTNLKEHSLPKLSDRFMGMRAAVVSNCSRVTSFASKLSFTIVPINGLTSSLNSPDEKLQANPTDSEVVSQLLELLGFSGGNVQDVFEYDLVFVHVKIDDVSDLNSRTYHLGWFDNLVGAIMDSVQPGSTIASRLHISVILSYGTDFTSKDDHSLVSHPSLDLVSDLLLLRPVQSYMIRLGNRVKNVRHHHPMLLAQLQDGVTRKDLTKDFSFEQFTMYGGNAAILADRFLHEVAFKLWKAPKYGA